MPKVRIFVDCDDTLILFDAEGETHPYGFANGTSWHPNQPLIDGLLASDAEVFIWSGGGKEYAQTIADQLGLSFPTLTKDSISVMSLVRPGDIVIDDQDLGGLRTHNPFEWTN